MERAKFRRELLHSLRYAPDRQAAAEYALRRLDELVAAAQKIAVTRETGELPSVDDDQQALAATKAIILLLLEMESDLAKKEAEYGKDWLDHVVGPLDEEEPR